MSSRKQFLKLLEIAVRKINLAYHYQVPSKCAVSGVCSFITAKSYVRLRLYYES